MQEDLEGKIVVPFPDGAYIDCVGGFVHLFDAPMQNDDVDLWVRAKCSLPWCSNCEPIRQYRIAKRMERYLIWHENAFYRFVTFSVRNERSFSRADQALKATWKKFVNLSAVREERGQSHTFQKIRYYIGWKEVVYSPEAGFNIHVHMFVGTVERFWDWKECHRDWNLAAGHEAQWNEQPLASVDDAVRYAMKYAYNKGYYGGLTRDQTIHFSEQLRGWNRLMTKRGTVVPHTPEGWIYCCAAGVHGVCNGGECRLPVLLGNGEEP